MNDRTLNINIDGRIVSIQYLKLSLYEKLRICLTIIFGGTVTYEAINHINFTNKEKEK